MKKEKNRSSNNKVPFSARSKNMTEEYFDELCNYLEEKGWPRMKQ